jgi:hypothetical protein
MQEYYILTLDPNLAPVCRWIDHNHLTYEVHLNRTRFWVPEGTVMDEFLQLWAGFCSPVED